MRWWTNKEDEILKMIVKDARPLHKLIHHLPGRSTQSAIRRMRTLGLSKATKDMNYRMESIAKVLREGDKSITQIAEALDVSNSCIQPFVAKMHAARRIHIVDRILSDDCKQSRTRIFRYGKGVDMPPKTIQRMESKKTKKAAPKEVVKHDPVRRDPFVEAMYGSAAA